MAEKTYQEKLDAKIEALRVAEAAKAAVNKDKTYRALVVANKVEAARDSLAVNLAIAKERAELSLTQRLAQADAILALSAKDRTKLQNASKALQAPKAPKAPRKTKASKANGNGKTNGKTNGNGKGTAHIVTDVRPN